MAPTTPATGPSAPGLSVIAPCFNEEANIDALIERVLTVFDGLGMRGELVLVDDGSADRTWDRIHAGTARDERVVGVAHPCNMGMACAWRTGLANATGTLVCLIDADLQNRPEDIPRLLRAYDKGQCDLVQAVRHAVPGARRCVAFTRGLNLLLNVVFRMRARDNKSGFLLCHRDVFQTLLYHRFRYRYYQSFIGAAAHVRGFTVGEVDTDFDPRHGGASFLARIPIRVSVRILWELVKFRIESWMWSPGVDLNAAAPVAPARLSDLTASNT